MKKIIFLSLSIFSLQSLFAQDAIVSGLKTESEKVIAKDPKDTVQKVWKTGGLFNLNVNQGSLTNWSAGGDKFSFSLNSYLNLYAFYKKDKKSWDNSLDMTFGVVQTTSLGRRKSSDRLEYTSKYGHAIAKKVNLAGLLNVRSQFANGYSYAPNAAGVDTATLTSKSFAPTYVLLSPGFDFKPNDNLSVFVSPITARWILVSDKNIGHLYGLDSGKTVSSDFGAFLTAKFTKKFGENIVYKTKLDLFSNYKHDPQNIDVFWTNSITAKISKYINFSLNVDLIYDNDIQNVDPTKGPAPQISELMGIGFAYKFAKK